MAVPEHTFQNVETRIVGVIIIMEKELLVLGRAEVCGISGIG